MALDLTPLRKAVSSLNRAVERSQKDPEDKEVRDAVIQRFGYAFELSWKFMRRWIKLNRDPADADPRTMKDLFRETARVGLIRNPEPWFEYAEARNLTSHSYDEEKAEEVYESALGFVEDSKALLSILEHAND